MGNKFGLIWFKVQLFHHAVILILFPVIGKSCITLFLLPYIELFENMNKRNMIGTHMAL